MNDLTLFEEKVNKAIGERQPNPEFVSKLGRQIAMEEQAPRRKPAQLFGLPMKWSVAAIAVAALMLVLLAVGPSKVYAQIRALFGYVPGAGIVDVSSPVRVLAEPASVTMDGVTMTIGSAILNEEETVLSGITIEGLSPDTKIKDFSQPFCDGSKMPYLLLRMVRSWKRLDMAALSQSPRR